MGGAYITELPRHSLFHPANRRQYTFFSVVNGGFLARITRSWVASHGTLGSGHRRWVGVSWRAEGRDCFVSRCFVGPPSWDRRPEGGDSLRCFWGNVVLAGESLAGFCLSGRADAVRDGGWMKGLGVSNSVSGYLRLAGRVTCWVTGSSLTHLCRKDLQQSRCVDIDT